MLHWQELTLRLVLAAAFGAVIGLERERKDWAAGMRTHMMVSLGACLMMMVSSFGFNDVMGLPNVSLDPSRVASQIITGIGFIGAGAIIFLKPAKVLGLTTASGLWTVCGIGMATGGGMYYAAVAATVLSIIILWGMQPLQKRLSSKFGAKSLVITISAETDPKEIAEKLWENETPDYVNFSITRFKKKLVMEIYLKSGKDKSLLKAVNKLKQYPGVRKIEWSK